MSTATILLDKGRMDRFFESAMLPAVLSGDTAIEGTGLIEMADSPGGLDGATGSDKADLDAPATPVPELPRESDAELTARFERDAIPLLDQL